MAGINETAAVIALVRRGDRYWHEYAQLIESNGSALRVLFGDFDEPGLLAEPKLFDDTPPHETPDLHAIEKEIADWRRNGIRVVTVLDDEYPSNLRTIHNRPPLLFVRGQLVNEDVRSVAIVGTRKASAAGLSNAAQIAQGLAEHGYTIASGLAMGIDTAAHETALSLGSRTIAVIGTGLNRSYPAANKRLQEEIATRSAVISQFWPDSPPSKTSFPMRNIVMSGIAQATVVVEASGASGARQQARRALEHGRPVFLHSSLLEHEWAREYESKPGTTVIESADEVVDRLKRRDVAEVALA